MRKFGKIIKKTWVFAVATALIAGSTSVMAFALNNSIPKGARENIASTVSAQAEKGSGQAGIKETPPVYTVVDMTKERLVQKDLKDLYMKKLLRSGMTQGQAEEEYSKIINNMTPGSQDITADKAASYAAGILVKAYGVDFSGYTATAGFSRNNLPNSGSWIVTFSAPKDVQTQDPANVKTYLAYVDSVTGTIRSACVYYQNDKVMSNDLDNPSWVTTAKQDVAKLIPSDVTITGTSIVQKSAYGGVMVVCNLSDGKAVAVRMTGENKDAAAYVYFPNGYDGSLNNKLSDSDYIPR